MAFQFLSVTKLECDRCCLQWQKYFRAKKINIQKAVPKTKIQINLHGRSALFREECTNLRSNHELYIKKNYIHEEVHFFSGRSALLPGKISFLEQPSGGDPR